MKVIKTIDVMKSIRDHNESDDASESKARLDFKILSITVRTSSLTGNCSEDILRRSDMCLTARESVERSLSYIKNNNNTSGCKDSRKERTSVILRSA